MKSIQREQVMDLLKNYEIRCAFIENIEYRMEVIRARCATGYDRELADREIEELNRQRELANAYILLTDNAMKSLTDAERRVLYHFFVHRVSGYVDTLCEELFCEERQLYKYKESGLSKLCGAIYGICDNN